MAKARIKRKGKGGGKSGGKQAALPGMELPKHAEIEAAAEDLDEANKGLSKAHDLREEKATRLLSLMKKRNLDIYRSEELGILITVNRTESEKVKVTKLETPHADSDDQAAAE